MTDEEMLERFKMDVAKFSGHYKDFLIFAVGENGSIYTKSSDKTWANGAAWQYLKYSEERIRMETQRDNGLSD